MNKNDEKQITVTTVTEQYPKLYSTPSLLEYGTLIGITQNGSNLTPGDGAASSWNV